MTTAPGIFWSLISWLNTSAIFARRCEESPTSSGFAGWSDCAEAATGTARNATAHNSARRFRSMAFPPSLAWREAQEPRSSGPAVQTRMRDRRPSRRLALEEALGVVAGDEARVERAQRRALDATAVGHVRAAGREHAALRRVERRWQLTLEHDALALDAGDARRRGEESLGVGMERAREDTLLSPLLDGVVVRDEEVGEPELLLQVGQEVQHLGLDRDVERRHRLIRDEQLRRQHQRPRDGDALALAAGEHVRIAGVVLGAKPDLRHHGAGASGALGLGQVGVDDERLLEDRADLLARVERAVGVLEHELDGAAQALLLAGGRVDGVEAVEGEGARRRRLDQGHDAGERGLAAAGFADDRERAPGLDREGHAADRVEPRRLAEKAAPDRIDLDEVAGPDDRRAHDAISAPTR